VENHRGKDLPDLTAHIKATWTNRDSDESYYKVLAALSRQEAEANPRLSCWHNIFHRLSEDAHAKEN